MKLATMKEGARRILIYGAPKTGKTRLGGSIAECVDKVIWLDLEAGVKTLQQLPEKLKQKIEVVRIPDWKDFPIAAETVLKILSSKGELKVCDTHGKVNCTLCKDSFTTFQLASGDALVIDSVTQLSNSLMNNITKGKPDDYKPSWEDWRTQGMLLEKIFSALQQAPYHVIAITHETLVEMEDKKLKIVPTAGSQNFSKTFARYFDDVIYTDFANGKFRANIKPQNAILAGTRRVTDKAEISAIKEIF